jgi:predicted DNA-binding WGR domain protein
VLARQVKGFYADELTAQNYLGDLVNEKIGKGYVDIESGQYDGSLTVNSPEIVPHLESGQSKGKTLAEVFEKEAANVDVRRVEELVCLDNSGMEDKFDKNISYVCEPHPDADLIYVYDKFGNKGEFLVERFGLSGKSGRAK